MRQTMIGKASRIRVARSDARTMTRGPGIAVCAALFGAVIMASSAVAQWARTEPQAGVVSPPLAVPPPAAQPAAPPPAANYQPGFIDVFGRFIGDSAAQLGSQLRNANQNLGDR